MVEGEGYDPSGRFILGKKDINPGEDKAASLLLEVAANCNNSSLEKQKEGYRISGDHTEGALRVLAAKAGFNQDYPRLHEIPFDSERKLMSVIIDRQGEAVLLVKGALETIITRCIGVMEGGKVTVLRPGTAIILINCRRNGLTKHCGYWVLPVKHYQAVSLPLPMKKNGKIN